MERQCHGCSYRYTPVTPECPRCGATNAVAPNSVSEEADAGSQGFLPPQPTPGGGSDDLSPLAPAPKVEPHVGLDAGGAEAGAPEGHANRDSAPPESPKKHDDSRPHKRAQRADIPARRRFVRTPFDINNAVTMVAVLGLALIFAFLQNSTQERLVAMSEKAGANEPLKAALQQSNAERDALKQSNDELKLSYYQLEQAKVDLEKTNAGMGDQLKKQQGEIATLRVALNPTLDRKEAATIANGLARIIAKGGKDANVALRFKRKAVDGADRKGLTEEAERTYKVFKHTQTKAEFKE